MLDCGLKDWEKRSWKVTLRMSLALFVFRDKIVEKYAFFGEDSVNNILFSLFLFFRPSQLRLETSWS